MYYTPINYDKLNVLSGTYSPNPIKPYNNQSYAFWERSLFQRACAVLEFDLPEDWQGEIKDFFLYCLFKFGYVGVAENDEFGLFFQPCSLKGYNFYYQPTNILISNPLMNKEFTIGEDCELIKLTPDYMGVWDVISFYAEKLSELDNAINMSIINNKYPFILGARNKASAEALKKIMDKANKGEPLIITDMKLLNDQTDKDSPFQFLERGNLKQSYVTTEQLQDFQTLLSNFDCEIGIKTIGIEKKERMVTSEAEARTQDSIARCTIWLDTLKSSIGKVNKMFGTNINVKMRFENEVSMTQEEGEIIE